MPGCWDAFKVMCLWTPTMESSAWWPSTTVHAHLSEELQQSIMAEFRKLDSAIRVVVSTVAFGIGVEVSNIRQVVHWGRLSSLMTYWQEVGRAGRDGAAARAVWYCNGASAGDDAVLKVLYRDARCMPTQDTVGRLRRSTDVSGQTA